MKGINDFSIGVDIESIARFKSLERKKMKHFLANIFTEHELDYCFSKKAPWQHLAARFAAKEAIVKAISSLHKKAPPLNKIEILNNAHRVPTVAVEGYTIKISLSHCDNYAIAFAIAEKK